ncbi:hypothetical protein [Streptomyces sp. NPDC026673]|uniref:hypothetical protein n=1 Tax=Streptomyces sp. NPDC026673 TaxID=3155724 RepID=UPI0033E2BF6F
MGGHATGLRRPTDAVDLPGLPVTGRIPDWPDGVLPRGGPTLSEAGEHRRGHRPDGRGRRQGRLALPAGPGRRHVP